MTAATAGQARLIRRLQERAARAQPALHTERVDGWWLRHTDTAAWWINSVLPHGPGDLDRGIRLAEQFYGDRRLPARFQITTGICPDQLDGALVARGYRLDCPMTLRTASTIDVIRRSAAPLRTRTDDHPTDGWFEAWLAVHRTDAEPGAERRLLRRVDRPSCYVSAVTTDGVVAVGRGVADGGWAGVFSMATLPAARRKGAAQSVLAGLARWAHDHRAGHLYLQVERDNTAALRLYGRAGFTELASYHYRTAEGSPR